MFRDQLRQRFPDLPAEKVALLLSHYELLLRWNKTINLTSINELGEIVERHYCESIFLGMHLPAKPVSIADIGSGAGFQGFPVAVLRPDCAVTLIEAHQRKSVFLREASRKLPNVRVLSTRDEEIDERIDLAISRAVREKDRKRSLNEFASFDIIV